MITGVSFWREMIVAGLREDGLPWDWTTLGACRGGRDFARAHVLAKSEGIWAAADLWPEAQALSGLAIASALRDGDRFKKGDTVVTLEGPAGDLLALERTLLNLASYASGIATQTRRMVDAMAALNLPHPPRVTATRKTLPLYKDLCLSAVFAGGGHSHRVNLAGGVLIKENHIRVAGSIAQALEGARALAPHGLKLEIEVTNLDELDQALRAQADAVLLDNFSPELALKATARLAGLPRAVVVELSGGLDAETLPSYRDALGTGGIHLVSSGGLTHSVKAADFSLLVKPA